jgi:hypothetical protein
LGVWGWGFGGWPPPPNPQSPIPNPQSPIPIINNLLYNNIFKTNNYIIVKKLINIKIF